MLKPKSAGRAHHSPSRTKKPALGPLPLAVLEVTQVPSLAALMSEHAADSKGSAV
jgi:hypothetical protein